MSAACCSARIYWADLAGFIGGVQPDGSDITTVVGPGGASDPFRLAVSGDHLYWSEQSDQEIRRSNLDGSNVTTIIPFGVTQGVGELAVTSTHLYWSTFTDGIYRSNIDGTNPTSIIPSNETLSMKSNDFFLFWTDSSDQIFRSDLDGNNVTTVFTSPDDIRFGLFATDSHLYWATSEKLQRSDLNGNSVTDVFDLATVGISQINDMFITDDTIYIADSIGRIRRTDLDGGNLVDLVGVPDGLDVPTGIVFVIPEPSYFGLGGAALAFAIYCRFRTRKLVGTR